MQLVGFPRTLPRQGIIAANERDIEMEYRAGLVLHLRNTRPRHSRPHATASEPLLLLKVRPDFDSTGTLNHRVVNRSLVIDRFRNLKRVLVVTEHDPQPLTEKKGFLSRIKSWLLAEDKAEPEYEDEDMYAPAEPRIIVGLGNPGRKYANTRHNAGWLVLDELAKRSGAPSPRSRFQAEISEVRYKDYRLVLVKPQTYMNESGKSVSQIINWYKVKPEEMLVLVDDLDIPFGRLRMRPGGSPGGHNGLKSIDRDIGTQDYPRLRIGIGRPNHPGGQAMGHVLGNFSPEERAQADQVFSAATDAIDMWLDEGILVTMNEINGVASVIS